MNTITINIENLPAGDYARHVAIAGHKPGVLSGAELKGKARTYGAWYYHQRNKVADALALHCGIDSEIKLINSRHCRVWTLAGKPVQVVAE